MYALKLHKSIDARAGFCELFYGCLRTRAGGLAPVSTFRDRVRAASRAQHEVAALGSADQYLRCGLTAIPGAYA